MTLAVTITRAYVSSWIGSQYAYPFSFPVGKQSGKSNSTTGYAGVPWTYGDLYKAPQLLIPVVALPVVALMFVWKGLK